MSNLKPLLLPTVQSCVVSLLKRFLQCAGEHYGVLNTGIHTLATSGAMNMRGIAGQQDLALPQNLGYTMLHVKPGGPHDAANCDGSILRSALFENVLKVCNRRLRGSFFHRRDDSEAIAGQGSHDDQTLVGKE